MSRRVAILTGAGGGIGSITASEITAADMEVILVDRHAEALKPIAERLFGSAQDHRSRVLDVSDYTAMERLVADVVRDYGRIDLFVANAGVADQSSVTDGDPQQWRRVVETNVLGVLYGARAVMPQLYHQRFGHIVVVASVSGRVTYVGEPAYVASKHAAVAFADCLRQEAAPHGIRVTVIEPGLVDTPLLDGNPFADQLREEVTPLNAADVARAIRFAVDQPPNCSINEIVLRPTGQIV